MTRRLLAVAASLVGLAVGLVSARLALSSTWYTFGDTDLRASLLGLAAGAALLVAGLDRLRGERDWVAGWLLTAAGTAWLVTAWDDPQAPAGVLAAGRILGTVWPVLVAHGLLRMFGAVTTKERAMLAAAYACTVGAGVAASILVDPAAHGCAACPGNPILLVDAPETAAWVERVATFCGPVWAALLMAALARRLFTATAARRRLMSPTVLSGMAVLAVVAAAFAQEIVEGLVGTTSTIVSTESVLLLLVSASTGWPALSLALTRQRLARLVVQASAVPPVGGLGTALGTLLRDPTARLLYPRDSADHHLIDSEGEPAQAQGTLTPLTRGTTTVAYLDHRAPLLEADTAVIAQVARLSLHNERLHAERAAQLRALRASRVRIVDVADREGRRLERDLHDGAQQRLVSLALGIRLEGMTLPSATDPERAAILDDAEAEVAAALAELRTIARGLFPRELADEGLEAALETFAETDPTPVELHLDLPETAPPAVESAAFYAVARLLATSTYTPAPGRAVSARRREGTLELTLRGSTRSGDLTTIEDRVGAMGGTVHCVDVDVGAVRIELPCGS